MSNESYNDLIDASKNTNAIQDDSSKVVESRYSVVIAAAKRARQIIDGAEILIPEDVNKKPLSAAIDEIAKNAVTIKRGSEIDEPIIQNVSRSATFDFATSEDDEDEEGVEDTFTDISNSSEDDYNSDSEA
ncbi:MAG TPA: DNA-directed RNA polymerase subunit omega [Oribacterium sp.]|jgi:DNA-directed RNA polymerase subunit omega|nr:DNA-directed RNA polymerase subunit omega [Oribacterium sp.]